MDWQLGGKTGTGPTAAKPAFDGWFAGLILEREQPGYAISDYVRGEGVAVTIAADLTHWLAETAPQR